MPDAEKDEDEFRPANIDSGPRCGECRLGLGVHNPEDPLCGTYVIPPGPTLTCEDLGCVNGKTIQGRKYDYDGTHEDQWAPCGRRADTCPIPSAADQGDTDA